MICVDKARMIRDRFDALPSGLSLPSSNRYFGSMELSWWHFGSPRTQKTKFIVVDRLPDGKEAIVRTRSRDSDSDVESEFVGPIHLEPLDKRTCSLPAFWIRCVRNFGLTLPITEALAAQARRREATEDRRRREEEEHRARQERERAERKQKANQPSRHRP